MSTAFIKNAINYFKNRVHGNTGRVPYNALTAEETKGIVVFLENYAEMHAILLPGRISGVKDYGKAKLMPSSVYRRMVYNTNADACGDVLLVNHCSRWFGRSMCLTYAASSP